MIVSIFKEDTLLPDMINASSEMFLKLSDRQMYHQQVMVISKVWQNLWWVCLSIMYTIHLILTSVLWFKFNYTFSFSVHMFFHLLLYSWIAPYYYQQFKVCVIFLSYLLKYNKKDSIIKELQTTSVNWVSLVLIYVISLSSTQLWSYGWWDCLLLLGFSLSVDHQCSRTVFL